MTHKELKLRSSPTYYEAMIVVDGYKVLTTVGAAPRCEAELALCLSELVRIGAIDIEKLRATLVLAEPDQPPRPFVPDLTDGILKAVDLVNEEIKSRGAPKGLTDGMILGALDVVRHRLLEEVREKNDRNAG